MNACESLLSKSPSIRPLLEQAGDLRLQVLVSWVQPGTTMRPVLDRSAFRADAEYFYPASSIKLCAAIAAVRALESHPCEMTLESPLIFHPAFPDQKAEDVDPTNRDGQRITLGHEIRKLFLVSDNQSFNRLYDVVGQQALNRTMWDAGARSVRITHRLSEARSIDENRRTRRVELCSRSGARLPPGCSVPDRVAPALPPAPAIRGTLVGAAFMAASGLLPGPKDFSELNRVSMIDLQDILVMLTRPDIDVGAGKTGWQMKDTSRAFLLTAMQEYPGDSANPRYDSSSYPDSYGKFLLPGLLRVAPKDTWLISNKVGQAYGFTVENAYVHNRRTDRACFVTAAIHTNANGVLNDDIYEYAEVGLPFMADLGESIGRTLV